MALRTHLLITKLKISVIDFLLSLLVMPIVSCELLLDEPLHVIFTGSADTARSCSAGRAGFASGYAGRTRISESAGVPRPDPGSGAETSLLNPSDRSSLRLSRDERSACHAIDEFVSFLILLEQFSQPHLEVIELISFALTSTTSILHRLFLPASFATGRPLGSSSPF